MAEPNVQFVGCYNDRYMFLIKVKNMAGEAGTYPTWGAAAGKLPVYISAPDAKDVNTKGICADMALRASHPCIKPFFGIFTMENKGEMGYTDHPLLTPLIKNTYINSSKASGLVEYLRDRKGIDITRNHDALKAFYLPTETAEALTSWRDGFKLYFGKEIFESKLVREEGKHPMDQYKDYYSKLGNPLFLTSIYHAKVELMALLNTILTRSTYYKLYVRGDGKLTGGNKIVNGAVAGALDLTNRDSLVEYGRAMLETNRLIGVNNFMGFDLNGARRTNANLFPTEQEVYDVLYKQAVDGRIHKGGGINDSIDELYEKYIEKRKRYISLKNDKYLLVTS